jgi:hypothetical protein
MNSANHGPDLDEAFAECPQVGLDYDYEQADYRFVLSRAEAGPYPTV